MTNYLLRTNQLARMRADVARLLPDTAVIQSVTYANNGAGGFSETWAPVTGGTVACRLDPVNESPIDTVAEAEGMKWDYQLTMPYDAPLTVNCRVVVDSNTYEVRQMDTDHSWNVSIRAKVARVV